MNVKIEGLFTLRSPLSHIGEAISTNTYLVQEPVLQPDGSLNEIFVYQGNAWRGQLRDLMAIYMLNRIQSQIPLSAFHFLFSGGRIGGEIKVDIAAMRELRSAAPMVALLGGGVGNQILPGKTRVSSSIPVCKEAIPRLPEYLHDQAAKVSYRQMTFEQSYSRKDDTKDDLLLPHLKSAEMTLLEGATAKRKEDGPADQMRMTAELVASGCQLFNSIYLMDVSEKELGCFVSALAQFAKNPHIGGMANKGHGLVSLDYNIVFEASSDPEPFVKVSPDSLLLAESASAAIKVYDGHLLEIYNKMLDSDGDDIVNLLSVA